MRVVVVRHAHAGDRERWQGDDRLRPLTKKGWRQADSIAELLERERPARLLCSPYVRCVQTLEPAAARLSLQVEATPTLAEGAGEQGLRAILEATVSTAACTHGDIMYALGSILLDAGLTDRREPADKGASWLLDVVPGRVIAAEYVPPPRRH